eukprot:6004359-Prymnesium_polylepis.1
MTPEPPVQCLGNGRWPTCRTRSCKDCVCARAVRREGREAANMGTNGPCHIPSKRRASESRVNHIHIPTCAWSGSAARRFGSAHARRAALT